MTLKCTCTQSNDLPLVAVKLMSRFAILDVVVAFSFAISMQHQSDSWITV